MFWRRKPKTNFTVTLGDAVDAVLEDAEATLAKAMREAIEGNPDITADELAKVIKPLWRKELKPLPAALGKRVDELAAELRTLIGEDEMRRRWRGMMPSFAEAKKDIKADLRDRVSSQPDEADLLAEAVFDEDADEVAADVDEVARQVKGEMESFSNDLVTSLAHGLKDLSEIGA